MGQLNLIRREVRGVVMSIFLPHVTNEAYLETILHSWGESNSEVSKVGNATIGGVTGEKWLYHPTADSTGYAIFLTKNGKHYVIVRAPFIDGRSQDYYRQLEQVIASVRFSGRAAPSPLP